MTAKGKLQCDLFVYKLAEELLLDFEPGLAESFNALNDRSLIGVQQCGQFTSR